MSKDGQVTSDPPPVPKSVAPRGPGVSEVGSWLIAGLLGGVLAVFVVANGADEEPRAKWLALAVQLCTPGILAFVAWSTRRPALYLAAAVIGMIVPFTAMSGVALPFFIPAGMSFVAYGRGAGETRGKLGDPAIAMLALVLTMAALSSLVLHRDPHCRTGPNFSDCSSDVVTPWEGALSLAFSAASIAAPIMLAAPGKKRRPSRSRP